MTFIARYPGASSCQVVSVAGNAICQGLFQPALMHCPILAHGVVCRRIIPGLIFCTFATYKENGYKKCD